MIEYLEQVAEPATAARSSAEVGERVAAIIAEVRSGGDEAVRRYAEQFDGYAPEQSKLSPEHIDEIVASLPRQVIDDIRTVQANVRGFAEKQLATMLDLEVEVAPGVILGHRHRPIDRVGAYVPGGRYALLASAHMTVLTAKVAGVGHVTACTPPMNGQPPAATIAALHLAGADEIHLLGGVQAITAMAVGTETIGKVDLVAGPGNAYVAEAKRQLFGDVGIDLLAGPTEVLIVADDTADPFTVAVDLLSQAEHGPDSPAVLVCSSRPVAEQVVQHIEQLLPTMPTREFAEPAWRDHGQVLVVEDVDEAFAVADEFASEHVQILTAEPRRALDKMRHYGALFLGAGTCVSYGDKVIGTNHTLPTRKAARFTGGLWVGSFLRTTTFQEVLDPSTSAALGELCGRASRVEGFEGHARSGDIRSRPVGDLEWVPTEAVPTPSG